MSSALENVLSDPRSIAARRELALEWRQAGDPRVELLELQLREHDGLGMRAAETVPDRIAWLIDKHGREWAGRIGELTTALDYQYGLVASINITGEKFVQHGAELVRLAPIVQLSLFPPIDLAAVAATPALAQMAVLYVAGGPWLNDEAIARFASSPNIRGLRAITLAGGMIGRAGLLALATSPHLPELVYIDVTGNPGTEQSTQGMQLQTIMQRDYILGPAGMSCLADAHDRAMQSYDVMNLSIGWPPQHEDLAFVDESKVHSD